MKTPFVLAATLLAAPLLSVSAMNYDPEAKAADKEMTEEVATETPGAEAKETKAEEKRICRRVRLDASSRRATKVCKTAEEWRLFNQRR